MLKCCRGLLALLVLAAAARGQDEPKIAWKFDKPFTQTWTTTAKQTLTIYADRAKEKSTEQN